MSAPVQMILNCFLSYSKKKCCQLYLQTLQENYFSPMAQLVCKSPPFSPECLQSPPKWFPCFLSCHPQSCLSTTFSDPLEVKMDGLDSVTLNFTSQKLPTSLKEFIMNIKPLNNTMSFNSSMSVFLFLIL